MPFVAAYFTASSAIKLTKPGSHIAVWILNVRSEKYVSGIKVVHLPGATSVNLAAQNGCFTLVGLSRCAAA